MADNRLEPVVLSEDERSTAQGLALRARIVLARADGGSNVAVAARPRVNYKTVSRWRSRFLRQRLDGLGDDPRPGVPRTITDAQVEDMVVRTLEEVPKGATHWSRRELARQAGISPSSVQRIWRAFGLQPWRTETFKISPDPLLIDKIRDVVGLYLAPPANAVVFSVDEKPQIQALERTAPVLPMLPGVPERRSFDYEWHGTADLFAALDIATGKVISNLSAQHTATDFRDFFDQIDQAVDHRALGMDQALERHRPALQVDQDPRPDHQRDLPLLRPNLKTSSLARPGRRWRPAWLGCCDRRLRREAGFDYRNRRHPREEEGKSYRAGHCDIQDKARGDGQRKK
jgi:transposase